MREKIVTGIDVGSSQVTCIIGHRAEDEQLPTVVGVGMVEGSGLRRGVVTDVEETVRAIKAAAEEAERMAGLSVDAAYVSVNGQHINAVNNRGLIAITRSHDDIGPDDVLRVIDTAQALSMPPNHEIIHVIPRTFAVDGQGGIKDPVGMTGSRLEVDAHIITGSTPFLKNLRRVVNQANVQIADLVLAPLAASKAVLSKKQKELGVALLDIGAGTTGLIVFEEGDIYHSAVLPVGASDITNDLGIVLKTSLEIAEKLKLEHGIASPVGLSDRETIDLTRYDKREEQVVSRRFLAEIIDARLSEIFNMVRSELRKVNREGKLPAGVVLSGGAAKMPGIVDSAKQHLQLPSQVGFPLELRGMIDRLDDPRYTTAVGLMLWGMDEGENKYFASEISFGSLISKIRNLFK